jgi:SAM-dependent methyltransferase
MLDQLREVVPEAEALEGAAESIPLPDGSVDAACAGQAFHWFDRAAALPELHRVVRDGGGLALLWNWWDERDPLQHELGRLVGYAGHGPYREEELPGAPWFRKLGRTVVETAPESSPDALVGYLATASMFLVAEPEEREQALRDVHALASRYGERFPLPRLTYVFAFERLGA